MIPEGWEIRKIGELVERVRKPVSVEKDAVYQQIGIRSHAKGLFYKEPVTGEQLGNKKVFWVEPNCFILNIVFAWERAVAATSTNETGMIASHRFPMFKPDENRLCLEYLTRYFHTPQGQDALSLVSPGGAGRNKTLDQTAFLKLSIPVPPLKEQKKIAEVLSSVDEAIASTQAVIDQTHKVKQGLLQQLLTRGIGHEKFKETAIGSIPNSWKALPASEVCELITKGTTPRDGQISKAHGEIPYLRVQNLTFEGKLAFSTNPAFISKEIHFHELKRSRVFPGDVLINIVGPPLGKVSVVPPDYKEWNINQAIAVFRPFSNYNTKFLAYWLQTQRATEWFLRRSKKTTSQQNLTLQLCKELPVPLPSPSEQVEIVERMELIDSQLSTETTTLKSLLIVKNGLMQDLLTGRVRVHNN